MGVEQEEEFRFDNIVMLYPAFGNNHERVNQLIPACMGHALAELPFLALDIISTMRNIIDAELNIDEESSIDTYELKRLQDLLFKVAFKISRCKEEFQQMSTDPTKRTFNSKYVSIKQTQPLSNGVLVRQTKGGERKVAKGNTGTQFPYFHILDWLLGRFQFGTDVGLVARIANVDDTFPRPQREFIQSLSKLEKGSTLRGFLEILDGPNDLLAAYNHVIECYGGEGGLLQAHCRKLYSYMHNNVQSSTSGTNHINSGGSQVAGGCPLSREIDNHNFANMMFRHMRKAAEDRWNLRLPPLMSEVGKVVYSTSESGGFTTVALDISEAGLQYEYGDIVKVLLPNSDKTTMAWIRSLEPNGKQYFKLEDMQQFHKGERKGWGWEELWEGLGWCRLEKKGGKGIPLEDVARYIELGQIRDDSNKLRWVHCPRALYGKSADKHFAAPPRLSFSMIASLEPVSPRVYSVSGVESGRVFLLVSKPSDGTRHHGYEAMSDRRIKRVHCSFSPATFFLVPPKGANLVCIASGTGISPFVGLVDAIGSREGNFTIVHQCKSSDLFLANSQSWLDFTAINPGAVVMGYISGDKSRRNCPMRYIIRNGAFEETKVLRRHNVSAYYFGCPLWQATIHEMYSKDGLNLAYCCGGMSSAFEPLKNFAEKEKMRFEFTCESYGVPPTLTKDSTTSQIGGTIVNLDHISPIHPGGDQILLQQNDLSSETAEGAASVTPDVSAAFYALHPHAYNLHRCLRTPLDAESEAFTEFLERRALSKSAMISMATKYAQVALASPDDSKIVRIATELQSAAIREQVVSGDIEGAQKFAEYLEQLLLHVPDEDQDVKRWTNSLNEFRGKYEGI